MKINLTLIHPNTVLYYVDSKLKIANVAIHLDTLKSFTEFYRYSILRSLKTSSDLCDDRSEHYLMWVSVEREVILTIKCTLNLKAQIIKIGS